MSKTRCVDNDPLYVGRRNRYVVMLHAGAIQNMRIIQNKFFYFRKSLDYCEFYF